MPKVAAHKADHKDAHDFTEALLVLGTPDDERCTAKIREVSRHWRDLHLKARRISCSALTVPSWPSQVCRCFCLINALRIACLIAFRPIAFEPLHSLLATHSARFHLKASLPVSAHIPLTSRPSCPFHSTRSQLPQCHRLCCSSREQTLFQDAEFKPSQVALPSKIKHSVMWNGGG